MSAAALRLIALATVAVAFASCGHTHATQSEARAIRAEEHDFDAAIPRSPAAKNLIDSYHIESEVLTIVVAQSAWNRLQPARQDAAKRTIWQQWRDTFERHHPGSTDRPFLKVEDLQGNDLGSYFQ